MRSTFWNAAVGVVISSAVASAQNSPQLNDYVWDEGMVSVRLPGPPTISQKSSVPPIFKQLHQGDRDASFTITYVEEPNGTASDLLKVAVDSLRPAFVNNYGGQLIQEGPILHGTVPGYQFTYAFTNSGVERQSGRQVVRVFWVEDLRRIYTAYVYVYGTESNARVDDYFSSLRFLPPTRALTP